MNKLLKIAGIATLVAVVGVVAVGAVAFAQEPPWKPPFPSKMPFHGPFDGTRRHGIDGPLGMSAEQARAYRGRMVEAFAEALGISPEDLKAAIARGQTPCEIIEAQGLGAAEVWGATAGARQELLQQAVEDELLTQQQADWIRERMGEHDPGDLCEDGLGHDGWELRPGFRGYGFRPEGQGWPQGSRLRGRFVMPGQ
jgi:hypothetical protein